MSNFTQKTITMIKTFYSFIAVLLITALVVSCASSSNGGGGDGGGDGGGTTTTTTTTTTETSIFSHSSYTFMPLNANISQTSDPRASAPGSIPTNGILLGSVLIKEAEINKLVAAEINKLITEEGSKVDAKDISIDNNYTIEYTFADDTAKDPNSILNRYLTIISNSDNSGVKIYAINPFAFDISLTDILTEIPSVTVAAEITITVSSLVNEEISISHTVTVRFPEVVDTFPNVNDAVSFNLPNNFIPSKNIPQNIMSNQSYTGSLSGSFAKGTIINGGATTSFTSLWEDATKQLASSEGGTINDNTFKLSDLLNATELPSLPAADIGIIQSITVTLSPEAEGASEFTYTYPAPAPLSATAEAPISIDTLNDDSSMANSLWKAISDENSTFTETNDAGIRVLNISIGWSFTYTYQRDFQPDDVIVPKTFLLNYTTPFVEEQAATTTISIGGVNNVLNRYGFTPNPGTGTEETRTIFFTLLDAPGAPVNSCNSNKVYLDNIDTRVKSAISFNYEVLYNEEDRLFKCVLGASFNGTDYQPLTAAIINTTTVNSKQASDCSHGEANELCYYVPLTINITNIDEAPTITAPPLSIDEGVGPTDTDYPGINFTPASGVLSKNDNTTGNLAVVLGDITIADTDEVANRTSKFSVNAAETKVVSVSPAHGNGLFSIVKQEGDNNLFTLRVDASSLDYEGFQPGELNAGKAIYMVTITTKDTDGTVANVKTQQVPVEITDVIFAPVAIGNSRLKLGFTKADNIESREDGRIALLPGASMLANGRTTLGTVKAVNPENNSDKELFYAVSPYDPDNNPEQTSNNFAVVDGFGDDGVQNLTLTKLGLTEVINSFSIHVQAFYRPANFDLSNLVNISFSLFTNTRNRNFIDMDRAIAIRIAVDDTAYSNSSDSALYINRTKSLNPASSPIFRARQFTGYVTEATSGDNVTGDATVYYTSDTPFLDSRSAAQITYPSVDESTFNFPPFHLNFIDIPQVPSNLNISPEFALVGAEGFGEFKLQDVGVNQTHSDLFSINKTTGAISLKGNNTVEFPDFYTVVVRLANASDINNAENALSHDYATVNILVNDINTAPVVSDFNNFTAPDIQIVDGIGSYNETTNKLTLNVTINENTPVGTVLARFTVTDDNDDMFIEHEFAFGSIVPNVESFRQNAVKLTFEPAASVGKQKVSTATLTLVRPLNFEYITNKFTGGNKTTFSGTISISDKGRYEYNPLSQPEYTSLRNRGIIALIKRFLLLPPIPLTPLTESQSKPVSPPVQPADYPLRTSLIFNLVVLDVAEKPLINTEASVTSGYIRENAPVRTVVNGILINIANINATDADALVYELSDEKFDEAFDVSLTATSGTNKRELQLRVADADKLENLGDGLVHTSNLTITNNTGGTGPLDRSDPIPIQVRVIDVRQPINPIAVDTTDLQIKETDVDGDFSGAGGDGRYVIKDNLFALIDVSKDVDDFLSIGGREPAPLVAISYAITDVSLERSTPDNATDIDVADGINFDLLSLLSLNPSDGNNNVSLAIEDTDYVEASLFGNISATLGFTSTFPGNAQPPAINPVDFRVEVIKANPKNVEYNTTSDNAPVYTFKYSQSDYADEVTADNVRADAILASAIVSGGLTTEGAQPQINVDNDTYNTELVRLDDADADDAYFIERDINKLNIIKVTKNNQQKVDNNGVIVIPFTSTEDITAANIQILSEDASGKLEDSADNSDSFYNYFDITVNNAYNFASTGSPEDISKALLITQKRFAVINSNGEVEDSIKYNALDTIPLFKGETETTNQTYYIRVSQGDTPSNASNYALAQVHLNIEAAGLNIPPPDCTFAEDVGGTTDCGLLTLPFPQVFAPTTIYNIVVGEVLADQEVNTDKLGLSNFTFTQIINGNPSDVVEPDDNDQLTLSANTTLNITINGIADNVFGEFYIDLVKSDNARVKIRYTISITPVNDAPVFNPTSYNFANIPFNSNVGYSVGNVAASDVDNDNISYNISGGTDDTALFQINSSTGEITLQAQAQASDLGAYIFNVIASDGKGGTATATISVIVGDLTPPVFTSTPYSFNLSLAMANAAGVVVGKVSAMDADGTPFDYSLSGSGDLFDDLFKPAAAANPDGSINIILRRAATLSDFAVPSVTFQVVATHQLGGLSSEPANIMVNLNNDLQPSDDFDGDEVKGLYDAFPHDAAESVTGNGESGTPYIISNIYQLQAIAGVDHEGTALGSSTFTNNSFLYGTNATDQLTKHYKLNQNIDASNTTDAAIWAKPAVTTYVGHGWTPIAGKSGQSFSGSFSGEGYAISNLNIFLRAAATTDSFGLFGVNNGSISAVGLENIEMRIQSVEDELKFTTGASSAPITIPNAGNGGLVGKNEQAGVIQYAYVSGLVNATAEKVGALVGSNLGEISYSYSTAAVEGRLDTGGLVGSNTAGGKILSSYATGSVNGAHGYRDGNSNGAHNAVVGSLVGYVSGDANNIMNASYATGGAIAEAYNATTIANRYIGHLLGQLDRGAMITSSYWYSNSDITDIMGIGNVDDDSVAGHAGLSNAQLQGCELEGTAISGAAPTTCTGLFPSSNWGSNTDTSADAFDITRSWVFNAGEYPSLNTVRSSDNKQLLPSAANQECQRNGMPLGCGEIEFVAVSGSGIRFTPAAGANPASYSFANILSGSPLGYSVGNVAATDPEGEAIAYNISGGDDDNALFQIDPTTGEITLQAQASDFSAYIFNVIASNSQGVSKTATISVSVIDPTLPVFTSTPYNFDLDLSAANAQGVVVGEVSAVDAEGSLFDYSLAGSDTLFEDLFELATAKNTDGSINIILSRSVTIDDLTELPVTFQIVVTHQVGGLSSDATVTVSINNDLPLEDDSDADGIADFYDADPNDAAVNVIGNGESDDPYIISNIYQLQAIAGVDHTGMPLDSSISTSYVFLYGTDAADQLTKHYKLANDIDASNTTDNAFWAKPAVGANNFIGHGWTPIAGGENQEFSGSFAGEGYHIHNLNMNLQVVNNKDTFGLFGTNGGNISAVGVTNINMQIAAIDGGFTNNVSLAGGGETESYTLGSGALVGTNSDGGRIKYTYSTGIVTVDGLYTGGLVGVNIGKITYSYSTATVTGRRDTGGLVGVFGTPAVISPEISSSYATGNVTAIRYNGNVRAGGLVGAMARIDSEISAKINATYTGQVENSVRYHEGRDPLGGPLVGTLTPNYNLDVFQSYWTNSTTNTFGSSSGLLFSNTGGSYDFPSQGELPDRAQAYVTFDQLMTCGLNQCTGFDAQIFASPHWDPNFDDPGIERGWIFEDGKYPALYANRTLNSVDTSLMPSLEAQDCHRRLASDACGTYDAAE